MRVTIDGSGNVVTHGDDLSGAGVISFPLNEPPGFPTGWTVQGTSPSRTLHDPRGNEVAAEDTAGPGPSQAGASGAVPDVEFFSGSTAVPDGFTNTNLAFVHLAPPGTDYHLLDLTDPTVPTIIEAGNYVFNMAVGGPQSGPYPSPTEFFWFGLDVTRPDGWGAYDDDVAPLVLTGTSRPVVTATVAYYCPAGTTITAAVRTNMAESYLLEGSIQMMARG